MATASTPVPKAADRRACPSATFRVAVLRAAESAVRRNRHVRPDQVVEIGIVRQFPGSADDPT